MTCFHWNPQKVNMNYIPVNRKRPVLQKWNGRIVVEAEEGTRYTCNSLRVFLLSLMY